MHRRGITWITRRSENMVITTVSEFVSTFGLISNPDGNMLFQSTGQLELAQIGQALPDWVRDQNGVWLPVFARPEDVPASLAGANVAIPNDNLTGEEKIAKTLAVIGTGFTQQQFVLPAIVIIALSITAVSFIVIAPFILLFIVYRIFTPVTQSTNIESQTINYSSLGGDGVAPFAPAGTTVVTSPKAGADNGNGLPSLTTIATGGIIAVVGIGITVVAFRALRFAKGKKPLREAAREVAAFPREAVRGLTGRTA